MYSTEYFRGMMRMPGHGRTGQARLQSSRVLVVGAGGLGCPVATNLVYSGVGAVDIVDHDVIEPSNLNRQFLFTHSDVGRQKSEVAAARLGSALPGIQVVARARGFDPDDVKGCDLVIDCTDSITAKRDVAAACRAERIPLILGAIYRNSGQICTFGFDASGETGITDVFGEGDAQSLQQSCSTVGVYGPHCMAIGAIMASEALRYLLQGRNASTGRLVVVNTEALRIDSVRLKSDTAGRKRHGVAEVSLQEDARRITLDDARAEGFTIIDVRTQDEVAARASGFTNIPMQSIILDVRALPADAKLAFICETGNRARIVCRHVILKTGSDAHRFIVN